MSPESWQSCAEWPESVYTGFDGTHVSKDGHDTEDAAKGVCRLLEREGFGGDREHFPIRTWVEPPERLANARKAAIERLKAHNGGILPPGYTEEFINSLSLPVAETLGIWKNGEVEWDNG